MPVMNGLDSTRNIRLFDASVPIIAVTASVDASEKHICISAGMNDVLCKPVVASSVLAAVRSYVRP